MNKFEYKTIFTELGTFKNNAYDTNYQEKIQKELNELGQQGWELMSSIALNQGFGNTGIIMMTFKRKIYEKEEGNII